MSSTHVMPRSGVTDASDELVVLLPDHRESVESLVIVHEDDTDLSSRLEATLDPETHWILRLPQSAWDFGSDRMQEWLKETLLSLSLSQLALVTHATARIPGEGADDESATDDEIMRRIYAGEAARQRVERHLIEQRSALAKLCASLAPQGESTPTVDALIFRPEIAEFAAYDAWTDSFRTLTAGKGEEAGR